MKIIFYSSDSAVENFFSSIELEDSLLTSSLEDLEKEFSSSDHSLVFLDFDCEELKCSDLANELNAIENINTILISGKKSIKEIMELQNSTSSCDAYLTKPLSVEILTGVINDFKIALSIDEDDSESIGKSDDNVDLTFVGVKKELIEQLNNDNTDVDSEDVEDEEDDIDFNTGQMQVASEVRDVIDSHRFNGADFNNVVNDEIQRKFDAVFGLRDEDSAINNEEFKITPQGFSDTENVDDNEDKDVISFNTENTNVPNEDEHVVEAESKSPAEEVEMSSDNDDDNGLEFNIPDDKSSEVIEEVKESSSDDLDFGTEDDTGGLEFNLGSEEVETTADVVSDDDLDFSDDTSEGVDLSSSEEKLSASVAVEEDDVGLSFDDGDDLSLGQSEESPGLSEEAVETDSISFDEDSGELNLNETYDNDTISEEDIVDDELDLSAQTEESEGMSFEDGDTSDADFEMGTDTSNDIESTISSIVAPVASDENSTGEFDLSAAPVVEEEDEPMQEFDYKTSSGFSPVTEEEEVADESLDMGMDVDLGNIGDNTNPTVIATTSSLTATDFESLGEDDSEEIDFGGISEDDQFDATETVASGFKVEEVENSVTFDQQRSLESDNVVRNYDEDEMLRLQGTIRQLREERESLMENINTLSSEKQLLSQDNLGLKAELDEIKIELEIVKKRSHDEISEMKYQMNLSHEKKDVYEMKYKTLYKEFDRLNQKVRIDFNQVKQREKELESKLELVVMDSDSQVQTRDSKILELKRKIDSLEFNMENTSIREQKHREDKSKLEERLAKIMKTLRGSIQLIEDDLEVLDTDNTTELDKN